MEGLILFAAGCVLGSIIATILTRMKLEQRSIGKIKYDNSDPDESPYLFLELHTDPNQLCRKKYVTLEVNMINYIPRK